MQNHSVLSVCSVVKKNRFVPFVLFVTFVVKKELALRYDTLH